MAFLSENFTFFTLQPKPHTVPMIRVSLLDVPLELPDDMAMKFLRTVWFGRRQFCLQRVFKFPKLKKPIPHTLSGIARLGKSTMDRNANFIFMILPRTGHVRQHLVAKMLQAAKSDKQPVTWG